jgi:hypothetical protein
VHGVKSRIARAIDHLLGFNRLDQLRRSWIRFRVNDVDT